MRSLSNEFHTAIRSSTDSLELPGSLVLSAKGEIPVRLESDSYTEVLDEFCSDVSLQSSFGRSSWCASQPVSLEDRMLTWLKPSPGRPSRNRAGFLITEKRAKA